MVYKFNDAKQIEKFGVNMHIYNTKDNYSLVAAVYQETPKGHFEEFYHEKSTFIYFIIEGSGTWIIEGTEYPVEAKDVVIIPPGKRFYYKGNLKQVCITAPAWDAEYERHVRNIDE